MARHRARVRHESAGKHIDSLDPARLGTDHDRGIRFGDEVAKLTLGDPGRERDDRCAKFPGGETGDLVARAGR